MKRHFLHFIFLIGVNFAFAQGQKKGIPQNEKKGSKPSTMIPVSREEKLSYAIGMTIGQKIMADSIKLHSDFLCDAIKAAGSGSGSLMTDEEIMRTLQEFEAEMRSKYQGGMEVDTAPSGEESDEVADTAAALSTGEESAPDPEQEKLALDNLNKGRVWLHENRKKSGVIELPSGLQYQVINKGRGPKPGFTSKVLAHYVGKKLDGTIFDSSIERDPAVLPVNGVIKGWTEALQLMSPGAKWKLFIPASLAYGNDAPAPIEPGEVLIFEVELLYVIN